MGSVAVESAHGGSVSVGSGSSEAFDDVVVTTRDGSETSGGMFVTTGGACLGRHGRRRHPEGREERWNHRRTGQDSQGR